MKNGYEQFFKSAKKAKKIASNSEIGRSAQKAETAEEYLRKALKIKDSKNKQSQRQPPKLAISILMILTLVAGLGYFFPDEISESLGKIEISFLTNVLAVEASNSSAKSANSAETNGVAGADVASTGEKSSTLACPENKGFTEEELSHFNRLNERKNELDRREAELSLLEEELHKQKSEIEGRITKLEKIREEVAGVLKDRVEVDQQRVNTLVDFYSNMKPKQAAEIFSNLNEDLAVEVLGKMKKKNAAEIMNLLPATKAKTLSEKFTGYKRR